MTNQREQDAVSDPGALSVRHALLTAARRRHEEWHTDQSSIPTAAERDRAGLLGELDLALDRVRELETALRDEVIEPFDDGLGVTASNYRRLLDVLNAGATLSETPDRLQGPQEASHA